MYVDHTDAFRSGEHIAVKLIADGGSSHKQLTDIKYYKSSTEQKTHYCCLQTPQSQAPNVK